MSRGSEGRGTWNRAGRRSGGAQPVKILVGGRSAPIAPGEPTMGPFCAIGRHAMCEGDCVCECHHQPK